MNFMFHTIGRTNCCCITDFCGGNNTRAEKYLTERANVVCLLGSFVFCFLKIGGDVAGSFLVNLSAG